MAANSQDNTHNDGFDFDAPQFTDFRMLNNEDRNSLEQYCQNYFDRKTEEIKRKSDEFDKEQITKHQHDHHNQQKEEKKDEHNEPPQQQQQQQDMSVTSDSDSDENLTTEPIANLLPAAEFAANLSSMSNRSLRSNRSSKSSRSHREAALSHLYSSNKVNKNRHALSSEELQLKRMEAKKMELDKLKEKNAKNVAKMKDDHRVFHPIRSTKLTVPITPALRTSLRAQKRIHHSHSNKENESMSHHSNAHAHSAANMKMRKRKNSAGSTTTETATATATESAASNMSVSTTASTATVPQSFKLSKSKPRHKRSNVLSSEQKELREIEQHGHFQARKINPKIFKSSAANLGILNNVKNKMTTTTVQPFHFLTEQRARKHQEMNESNNQNQTQSS